MGIGSEIRFTPQSGAETIVDTTLLKVGGRIRLYGAHRDNFLELRNGGVLWPYLFTPCGSHPDGLWTEFDISIDPMAQPLL